MCTRETCGLLDPTTREHFRGLIRLKTLAAVANKNTRNFSSFSAQEFLSKLKTNNASRLLLYYITRSCVSLYRKKKTLYTLYSSIVNFLINWDGETWASKNLKKRIWKILNSKSNDDDHQPQISDVSDPQHMTMFIQQVDGRTNERCWWRLHEPKFLFLWRVIASDFDRRLNW